MKITSKKTGHSFNLSGKGAADFFYAKNAKGKFINNVDNYYIDKKDKNDEISQAKFFIAVIGLTLLFIGSMLLHIHLNYV